MTVGDDRFALTPRTEPKREVVMRKPSPRADQALLKTLAAELSRMQRIDQRDAVRREMFNDLVADVAERMRMSTPPRPWWRGLRPFRLRQAGRAAR
jgi:hypothetical protein